MPEMTNYFADTTDLESIHSVIDETLRSLHISGSLLLREAYAPPWSITIPENTRLAELLDINPDRRVVAFHLVEFGHCEVSLDNGDKVLLRAGEMVICFGGHAHRLSQGRSTKTQPIEALLTGSRNLQRPDNVTGTAGVSLLCGVFLLRQTEFNPLLTALPPMLHAELSRPGELHNLSGVARLLAEEINRRSLGSGYVIERLLEVLCAEAVRAHIEAVPSHEKSWFRGVKDPIVGRAIAAIHAHPGDAWSVQRLADSMAISPSRFAARFSGAIGLSPMSYVTKWRMSVACRELQATWNSIDRIAADVGYESPAAFSRAFKKQIGVSPAIWRNRSVGELPKA